MKKRFLSIVVTLCMALSVIVVPTTHVHAADWITITERDVVVVGTTRFSKTENNSGQFVTLKDGNSGQASLNTSTTPPTLTLKNVNVTYKSANNCAIGSTFAHLKIVLIGNNTVTINGDNSIAVYLHGNPSGVTPVDASYEITGNNGTDTNGTLTLNVDSKDGCAIGTSSRTSLKISNTTITANLKKSGACAVHISSQAKCEINNTTLNVNGNAKGTDGISTNSSNVTINNSNITIKDNTTASADKGYMNGIVINSAALSMSGGKFTATGTQDGIFISDGSLIDLNGVTLDISGTTPASVSTVNDQSVGLNIGDANVGITSGKRVHKITNCSGTIKADYPIPFGGDIEFKNNSLTLNAKTVGLWVEMDVNATVYGGKLTITVTDEDANGIRTGSNSRLTFKEYYNSTTKKNEIPEVTITSSYAAISQYTGSQIDVDNIKLKTTATAGLSVGEGATFTFKNGTFDMKTTVDSSIGIQTSGTLNIEGGSLTTDAKLAHAISNQGSKAVTISGGTHTLKSSSYAYIDSNTAKGSLIVTSSAATTFNGGNGIRAYGTVKLTGGALNVLNSLNHAVNLYGTLDISGGNMLLNDMATYGIMMNEGSVLNLSGSGKLTIPNSKKAEDSMGIAVDKAMVNLNGGTLSIGGSTPTDSDRIDYAIGLGEYAGTDDYIVKFKGTDASLVANKYGLGLSAKDYGYSLIESGKITFYGGSFATYPAVALNGTFAVKAGLSPDDWSYLSSLTGESFIANKYLSFESSHTCVYDQQIASEQHLASPASCTSKAKYYKSCKVCGKNGTATFEYGDTPSHDYRDAIKNDSTLKTAGTCQNEAVYNYSCTKCGAVEVSNTHTFLGDKNPANHSGGTRLEGYVAKNHNTQTNGYSGDTICNGCGGTIATGTYDYVNSHNGNAYGHDATHHWKICDVVGCGVVVSDSKTAHYSDIAANKATCQRKAVCDACGEQYGTLGSHAWETGDWTYKAADGHGHSCTTSGCTAIDKHPHTPDHEGNATEEYAIKCRDCDYVIQEQLAHTCKFDKQIAEAEFLKSGATCIAKALYYKSCSCGKHGTETFEYGSLAAHTWETGAWTYKEADGHGHSCTTSGCTAIDKHPHTPDHEGNATEEYAIKCRDCDYVIQEQLAHTCKFDKQIAEAEFLKSGATCIAKALYYKSCSCGKHGTETFEYGDYAAHDYTSKIKNTSTVISVGTCKNEAVYNYSCSVCGAVENSSTHTFKGDKDSSKHEGGTRLDGYVAKNHNTQTNGYSGDTICESCGETIATGTYDYVEPHNSNGLDVTTSIHTIKCDVPGCDHIEKTELHYSDKPENKATCQKKAVCDVCKLQYGEKADHSYETGSWTYKEADGHGHSCTTSGCTAIDKHPHTPDHEGNATEEYAIKCRDCDYVIQEQLAHTCKFDKQIAEEKFLKSGATCTAKALYYKSCSCGKHGTETFEYGEPLDHTPSETWSKNEGGHWKDCSVVGCGVIVSNTYAEHDFEWKIDKEAAIGETGLKHQECRICHYEKSPVTIDALTPDTEAPVEDTEPTTPSNPNTEKVPPEEDPDQTTAPEEDPDQTTASEEDPDQTTAPEEDPDQTTAPEEDPDQTTAPEEDPDQTTAPEEDPDQTTAPEEDPDQTTVPDGTTSPDEPIVTPPTGDNMILWVLALSVSALGIITTVIYFNKRKNIR